MAMIMAAPQNGWGMVGIAPTAVRVYSIRVVPPGQTTVPFSAYIFAINRCVELQASSLPTINVINLALAGSTTPTDEDIAELQDTVEGARNHGLAVIAAAGNDAGETLDYPAVDPSVIAVGAGDASPSDLGVLCGFSNRGDLTVIAPGCDTFDGGIDEAFQDDGSPALGYGTSQASAITSAVVSAMRAYSPGLSVSEAEDCVTSSAENGGNLYTARAFETCGLGQVVMTGTSAIPSAPNPAGAQQATHPAAALPMAVSGRPVSTTTSTKADKIPRPKLVSVRVSKGVVKITILNRPPRASVEVKVLLARGSRRVLLASRTVVSSHITMRYLTGSVVEARFVRRTGNKSTSAWSTHPID
jgi:hypothetical protein